MLVEFGLRKSCPFARYYNGGDGNGRVPSIDMGFDDIFTEPGAEMQQGEFDNAFFGLDI